MDEDRNSDLLLVRLAMAEAGTITEAMQLAAELGSREPYLGVELYIATAKAVVQSGTPALPATVPQPPTPDRPGETITNSIGMKLVLIPAGEFMMGSPEGERGRSDDEGPQHRVRFTRPFYLGTTEVTQAQWQAVMRTNPWKDESYVQEGADYPATYVSWDDAVAFCEAQASRRERYTGCRPRPSGSTHAVPARPAATASATIALDWASILGTKRTPGIVGKSMRIE